MGWDGVYVRHDNKVDKQTCCHRQNCFLPFSYHCDTFGKNFKKDDGTFLHTYNIKCLATESWDSTEISHPCECNTLVNIVG